MMTGEWPTGTRKQKWITREARRKRAQHWLREAGARFHLTRDNTGNGAHITIWFTAYARVEWWPGTCRYRVNGVTHKYTHLDDFIEWVMKERKKYDE